MKCGFAGPLQKLNVHLSCKLGTLNCEQHKWYAASIKVVESKTQEPYQFVIYGRMRKLNAKGTVYYTAYTGWAKLSDTTLHFCL